MATINGINSTIPIPLADGGTNATTAAGARTSLGLVIGTNVEAWNSGLDSIASLANAGTAGFLAQNGANTFTADTLVAGTGILVTNSTGGGNPVFSLNANTPNTLQGFDSGGNPVSIGAGANITISGGVISSAISNTSTAQSSVVQGGDFGINPWQKGVSFTNLGVSNPTALTADRWMFYSAGVPTLVASVAQDTDVPTVTQTGFYTQFSLALTVGTADGSLNTNTVYSFRHCLEGYNWAQLAQQATVLTFWVKSSTTGAHTVCLQNTAVTLNYTAAYTISSANTWEQKSVTFTASPSAGTWNYAGGPGMYLHFIMAAGATLTGAQHSWTSATTKSIAGTVNDVGTNGKIFKIALVKWEPGSAYTGWFPEKFSDVLLQCQRFYYKTFAQGTAPANAVTTAGSLNWSQITAASTAQNGPYFTFPASMYVAGGTNITFYNPSENNSLPRDTSVGADGSAISGYQTSSQGMGVTYTNAVGSAVGDTYSVHVVMDNSI